MLMIAVLLLGLLHRECRGFGGIGPESTTILLIYGLVVAVSIMG